MKKILHKIYGYILFHIPAIILFTCFYIIDISAEQVYVIDEIKIGLHQEPSNQSSIIKLVPSGTELNVIERENDLIHVEEPEGVRGWINSKNVQNEKPGKAKMNQLEIINRELEEKVKSLKKEKIQSPSQTELEQQLKSERLRVGQLQVELTNIKSKVGSIDPPEKLLADIEQLKNANRQLIEQIESSGLSTEGNKNNLGADENSSFIFLLIVFLIGVASGTFILDYVNRRRHGGFRV